MACLFYWRRMSCMSAKPKLHTIIMQLYQMIPNSSLSLLVSLLCVFHRDSIICFTTKYFIIPFLSAFIMACICCPLGWTVITVWPKSYDRACEYQASNAVRNQRAPFETRDHCLLPKTGESDQRQTYQQAADQKLVQRTSNQNNTSSLHSLDRKLTMFQNSIDYQITICQSWNPLKTVEVLNRNYPTVGTLVLGDPVTSYSRLNATS